MDTQDTRFRSLVFAVGFLAFSGAVGTAQTPAAVWTQGTGWPEYIYVQSLELDPQNPARIWAGGVAGHEGNPGLFRSDDDGRSWVTIAGPDAPGDVQAIAIHPENASTIFTGFDLLRRSDDGGSHWASFATPGVDSRLVRVRLGQRAGHRSSLPRSALGGHERRASLAATTGARAGRRPARQKRSTESSSMAGVLERCTRAPTTANTSTELALLPRPLLGSRRRRLVTPGARTADRHGGLARRSDFPIPELRAPIRSTDGRGLRGLARRRPPEHRLRDRPGKG